MMPESYLIDRGNIGYQLSDKTRVAYLRIEAVLTISHVGYRVENRVTLSNPTTERDSIRNILWRNFSSSTRKARNRA